MYNEGLERGGGGGGDQNNTPGGVDGFFFQNNTFIRKGKVVVQDFKLAVKGCSCTLVPTHSLTRKIEHQVC